RIPQDRPFHHEQEPPFQYKRRDWAGPMYLAMLGNTGVINCYGPPPFDRKGARPVGAPDYHGEVWIKGRGSARIASWTPNQATAEVRGPEPGSILVYNMNFDEGCRSDAGPVVSQDNAIAAPLVRESARVPLRYRPPYLGLGLAVAAIGVGVLAWLYRRERA